MVKITLEINMNDIVTFKIREGHLKNQKEIKKPEPNRCLYNDDGSYSMSLHDFCEWYRENFIIGMLSPTIDNVIRINLNEIN